MLFQIIEENGVKRIQALTADTGTGAPVGSIIVVCSNILPSGYLGLGVQYDITNYPALYQVLGTDTTPTASALGLPTLSSGQYAIKATSGLTENQQENVLNTINENLSYSTTEHKTGKKWIDGKDIYSKVVMCDTRIAIPTGAWTSLNSGFSELASLVPQISIITNAQLFVIPTYIKGFSALLPNQPNVGDLGIVISEGATIQVGGFIILEYTKTTDN